MFSKFKIGNRCKCLHPYAYRGEEPFTIVAIHRRYKSGDGKLRAAYIVEYADGAKDAIPVKNEGGYEMILVPGERIEEKGEGH